MATTTQFTARSLLRRGLHLVFPSWRRVAFSVAVFGISRLLHLSLTAHLVLFVVTRLVLFAWSRYRRA